MDIASHSKAIGYGIIVAGLALAFVAAVVPHYGHYKLAAGVLLAAVLPYLGYGIVVVFINNVLTIAVGILLLAIQGWLVISERFSGGVDYSDGRIYFVPLVLMVLLLPLVVMALRQPWHK